MFVVHGETSASDTFAEKVRSSIGLEAHVPMWRERLILKPAAGDLEVEAPGESPSDFSQSMANSILDLEKELDMLKRRLKRVEETGEAGEDEVDKLAYIREELQNILQE